jgi:hypothetical protein
VDILHEFELGVWKSVLVHLVHILYTTQTDLVREMNERSVATFYLPNSQ